jgi:hypothetical protein
LYIAEAAEWIASNASLLNLRLVAIANLHSVVLSNQLIHLVCRQSATHFDQLAELGPFIVLNIGSIPLSEQVLINPIVTCSRQNDGAVLILPDPLLKNTAVQVISLSQDDLPPVRRSE